MRLERLHKVGSVSINVIFSLKLRDYGPKGNILDHNGIIIFWFIILLHPIRRKMFIGLQNGYGQDTADTLVSVEYENTIIPVSNVVFIVQD